MSETALQGGVIAAGDGSRLKRDGWAMPKALVPVAGLPLIDSVLRNFAHAGIRTVTIIVNEGDADGVAPVCARFPELSLELIVKTTASSFESFSIVARTAGTGRMLISTVDAWCRPAAFARFVDRAATRPDRAVVLGVTPLVAAEKPLWVDVDGDGRVTAIDGDAGRFVTAGLYLVPAHVRRMAPPRNIGRLREFLTWVHRGGCAMYGDVIDTVVDVDRGEDVALAESFARAAATGPAGVSRSIQG